MTEQPQQTQPPENETVSISLPPPFATEPLGDLARAKAWLQRFYRKYIHFFVIHLAIFIFLGLIGSVVIYGIELGGLNPIEYVDALFMSISAITVTGLATVDVNKMRVGSVVVIGLLMFAGGLVLWTLFPLLVRRRYFRREYGKDIELDELITKHNLEELAQPSICLDVPVFDQRVLQYRAMGALIVIVSLFLATTLLVSFTILSIYLTYYAPANAILTNGNVLSPVGFAAFTSISAFNNAGFTLLSLSLVPFQTDGVVLLTLGALVLLGNTMYPSALRLVVWIVSKAATNKEPYIYLLAHPRECYLLMFPAINNYVLLTVTTALIIVDWMLFLGIDYDAPPLIAAAPAGKVIISFFQTISTRTLSLSFGYWCCVVSVLPPLQPIIFF